MTDSLEDVLYYGLAAALDDLPSRAVGLRSHAISTEEHINEVLRALVRLHGMKGSLVAIVGRPSGPVDAKHSFLEVLEPHAAAARATSIRNDPSMLGENRLIYLNAESSPGEAGLDMLIEVTPQQLALGFASATDLPVLKTLASHKLRRIVSRVEDAPIELLAAYQLYANSASEPEALPILGLVPATLSGARSVEPLTSYTGSKLAAKLADAERALSAASDQTRLRVAQELLRRACVAAVEDGAPEEAAIETALRLCRALRRFATGLVDVAPETLCGLSVSLIRLLRKGEGIVDKLLQEGSTGSEVGGDGAIDHPSLSEEEVLELRGAAALEAPILTLSEDLDQVELEGAQKGDSIFVHGNRVSSFLSGAIQGELGNAANLGCALRADQIESVLRGAAGRCEAVYVFPSDEFKREPPERKQAVEQFLARRSELFAAVEDALTAGGASAAPGELVSELGALAGLAALPLLLAQRLSPLCDAYVRSYSAMVSTFIDPDDLATKKLEDWLVHLDLAFAAESGTVQVASLLPAHPVRVARSLLWVRSGARPPRLPSTVAITYKGVDRLVPHALEDCYHRELTVGPTTPGVVACAVAGLDQLWTVVVRESLAPALDIELLDVSDPAPVIAALMQHCEQLFNADRRVGPWVLLRVSVASSDDQPVSIASIREQISEELTEYLDAPTGQGLTLQLQTTAAPGTQWRHLVVQGIETPYRRLPDDQLSGTLDVVNVAYVPSSNGAIASIEIRGELGTDAYGEILTGIVRIPTGHGRDPGDASPPVGNTLIRSLVCNGGWPIRPEPSSELISYGFAEENVFAVLANHALMRPVIEERLRTDLRIPKHLIPEELGKIEEGMLRLYPCRNFLRNLLAGRDQRHLRADRALMTALREASTHRQHELIQALTISLDSPEGIRWAKSATSTDGYQASGTRADLIILEADEGLTELLRIRVVELKASESAKSLGSRLRRFADQPVRTKSRIDRLLTDPVEMSREVELFRSMVWLGAGHQQQANAWRTVLEDLDAHLHAGRAIQVVPECWLVPDSHWEGEPEFSREFEGEGGTTSVFFKVLAPLPEEQRETTRPAADDRTAERKIEAPSSASAAPATDSSPGEETRILETMLSAEQDGSSPAQTAEPDVRDDAEPVSAPTEAGSGMVVNIGRFAQDGRQAIWMPNRTDLVNHFNVGITGTMGTGKTQLVKSLVAQLVHGANDNVQSRPPGVLVFDYKGDYGAESVDHFPDYIGAKVLKAENLPLNPLRLVTPRSKRDFKVGELRFVATLLSVAKGIGPVQRNELGTAVRECVRLAGIDPEDADTWTLPFPTLTDLLRHLRENNLAVGTPQSILEDLVGLEVFSETDPDNDIESILNDITVIDLKTDLSGMPHVTKLIIGFFMNGFYTSMMRFPEAPTETRLIDGEQVQLRQLRRIVLVDEADDFMSLNLQSLKDTMQQGRSFGCGVILSTQFLKHFEGSDAPLRQLIGTWLMHCMAEVRAPEVKGLFGVKTAEAEEIRRKLVRLEKHHSYAVGLSSTRGLEPANIIRDLPFYQLRHRGD